MTLRALGLMSGTSMDGVDAALIETDGVAIGAFGPTLFRPYDAAERAVLRAALESARDLRDRDMRPPALAEAEAVIDRAHIDTARALAARAEAEGWGVDLVGFHGQTVLHRPERRLTVQIGSGRALADALGVPVVYDFRAADVAAGGQGAPLVPVFHEALVAGGDFERPVAVLNLGGVGNVTWIGEGPANALLAFDTGPGNALIDDWLRATTGRPYDAGGALAASGRADAAALEALLAHPYFAATPPKSLDRDDFAAHARAILRDRARLSPADGAATLTAFTAAAVARALDHMPARPRTWIVAGGGSHNATLLHELRTRLGARLMTAGETGWSPDFVEAQAFAYLAARSLRGLPLTFPGTTGVARPLLGGVLAEPSGQAALSAGARPSRRSR